MQVLDLVLQIFMAVSLISGIIMITYTISYRDKLTKIERMGRFSIGSLLVYSVVIRFMILLPGRFPYMRETSVVFDLLYIAICVFYNVNLFNKISNKSWKKKKKG